MGFFGVVNVRRSVRQLDGEPVGRSVVERTVAGVVMTLAFLSGCAQPEAVWRYRPAGALAYEEALGSELVVVAHYEDAPSPKKQTGRFAFRVDRVLNGSDLHSGQIIQVAVGDPYYIAPPWRGPFFTVDRDRSAGIALYYTDPKWPSVNRPPSPVVVDLREPRLYFFPKRHEPQLRLSGQVGHTWQVDAWAKAVAGDDPGVVFRLMQPLSSEVRQQGFDAMYVQRGSDAIRDLVELVAAPPNAPYLNADEVLLGIGDQNGDVYAPALKRLEGMKEDEDAYVCSLAELLARLDGERAVKDFTRILARRDRCPRRLPGALARALGYVPTRRSLAMLVSLAGDSETSVAAAAFEGLHAALYGPFGTPSPQNLRLRARARPLLRDVLTDERLREINAPFHMRRFMWTLYPDRYRPRRWSMEQLDDKLLRPDLSRYGSGGYECETSGACGFILQESDPKYVPLLVKAFKTRREPRTEYAPHFRQAFGHYLFMHRNAMLCEIKAQKAIGLYYKPKLFDGYAAWALLAEHPDQGPTSVEELEAFRRCCVKPERYVQAQHRSGVARRLQAALRRSTNTLPEPNVEHIRWLSLVARRLDPSTRDELVAGWRQWRSQVRINLLSLAVRHGRSDLVGPLIAEVRIALRCMDGPKWPKTGWYTEPLLTADNPKAQREYLRLLDTLDRAGDARPNVSPNYRMEYLMMLEELYPEHRSQWARRVRTLLGSVRLSDRQCGMAILRRMGLVSIEEAVAMKRPDSRIRTVARLQGIARALVSRSEESVFLKVLRGREFDLPTAAGPDALRGLVGPLLAYESATAKVACSLIVRITGNPEFTRFLPYPPPDRRKHLAAYAEDRGLAWLRQTVRAACVPALDMGVRSPPRLRRSGGRH